MNDNELHNNNSLNQPNPQPTDGRDSDIQKIETGFQEQPIENDNTSIAPTRGETWAQPQSATPVPIPQPYSPSAAKQDNSSTTKSSLIAGFSIGVACFSLLGSWIPIINIFSIIIALVAIILGIVGMFKSNKALSITGLVISVITILVAVGINILFFVVADTSSNSGEPDANKSKELYKYNEKQDDFYEST
jgi:hypothetical protein